MRAPFRMALLSGCMLSITAIGQAQESGHAAALAGVRVNFAENFLFETTFKFSSIFTDKDLRLNRLSFALGVRF